MELLKMIVEKLKLPFGAEALTGCTVCAATLAVTIAPAEVPNVTLFAFEKFKVWNVNEPSELETAWLLWLVRPVATDALIILPALVPKVTPFALENPSVENRKDPFEAEAATGCVDCALEAEAVTVDPAIPKVTLLELLNTVAPGTV